MYWIYVKGHREAGPYAEEAHAQEIAKVIKAREAVEIVSLSREEEIYAQEVASKLTSPYILDTLKELSELVPFVKRVLQIYSRGTAAPHQVEIVKEKEIP